MRKYMLLVVVVTAVTGVAHAQTPTRAEMERELLKHRLYATMRDADPDGYDFALSRLTEAGTTDLRALLTPKAQVLFQLRILEWIHRGTDAAVVDYHRALIARLDAASRVSATECHNLATAVSMINPEIFGMPAVAKPFAAVDPVIALLESTSGRARPVFDERAMEPQLKRLVTLIAAVSSTDRDRAILGGTTLASGEYVRSCALHTALYKRMIELPVAEAAAVLRAWLHVLL